MDNGSICADTTTGGSLEGHYPPVHVGSRHAEQRPAWGGLHRLGITREVRVLLVRIEKAQHIGKMVLQGGCTVSVAGARRGLHFTLCADPESEVSRGSSERDKVTQTAPRSLKASRPYDVSSPR